MSSGYPIQWLHRKPRFCSIGRQQGYFTHHCSTSEQSLYFVINFLNHILYPLTGKVLTKCLQGFYLFFYGKNKLCIPLSYQKSSPILPHENNFSIRLVLEFSGCYMHSLRQQLTFFQTEIRNDLHRERGRKQTTREMENSLWNQQPAWDGLFLRKQNSQS